MAPRHAEKYLIAYGVMMTKPKEYVQSLTFEECAELDRQGIKIIGLEFDYDHSDRSWADINEIN